MGLLISIRLFRQGASDAAGVGGPDAEPAREEAASGRRGSGALRDPPNRGLRFFRARKLNDPDVCAAAVMVPHDRRVRVRQDRSADFGATGDRTDFYRRNLRRRRHRCNNRDPDRSRSGSRGRASSRDFCGSRPRDENCGIPTRLWLSLSTFRAHSGQPERDARGRAAPRARAGRDRLCGGTVPAATARIRAGADVSNGVAGAKDGERGVGVNTAQPSAELPRAIRSRQPARLFRSSRRQRCRPTRAPTEATPIHEGLPKSAARRRATAMLRIIQSLHPLPFRRRGRVEGRPRDDDRQQD
jgi:hypothetical protein